MYKKCLSLLIISTSLFSGERLTDSLPQLTRTTSLPDLQTFHPKKSTLLTDLEKYPFKEETFDDPEIVSYFEVKKNHKLLKKIQNINNNITTFFKQIRNPDSLVKPNLTIEYLEPLERTAKHSLSEILSVISEDIQKNLDSHQEFKEFFEESIQEIEKCFKQKKDMKEKIILINLKSFLKQFPPLFNKSEEAVDQTIKDAIYNSFDNYHKTLGSHYFKIIERKEKKIRKSTAL